MMWAAAQGDLPLVLGTSSRWRRAVMDTTGLVYTVQTADIDERAITAGFPSVALAAQRVCPHARPWQ